MENKELMFISTITSLFLFCVFPRELEGNLILRLNVTEAQLAERTEK